MLKAVIFDMDGVIIDSEPLHFESDKRVMREYGHEITNEELNHYVGVANPEMWEDIRSRHQLAVTLEELLDKQLEHKKLLFEGTELEPIKGIKPLLEDIKTKRLKTGLASSSPMWFISLILERLGLKGILKSL